MNDIERAIEYLNGMRSFMQKRMIEAGEDKTLMKVRVEEIPNIDIAIAALQAQLDGERDPDGWVETEGYPPDFFGQDVWLYRDDDTIELGTYDGEGWYRINDRQYHGTNFTHWMPANVPQPPHLPEED